MEPLTRHPRSLGLVVLVFLGSLGCSHTPVGPSPVPAEVREQLGRIGVAYQGPASLTVSAKPVRGAAQGAGKGAVTALVGTFEACKGGGDPRGVAGLIILSPGIVAVGALAGAVFAPSAAAVEEAETVLDQAVADPDLPAAVRDRLLQAVQTQRPHAVPVFPMPDPTAEEEVIAQAARSHEGIDTVLEVYGPTIALLKGDFTGNINPALRLSISLYSRLIRTADRALLYTYAAEHRGEARTFTAWATNNAQPLREEVDRASATLATQIVAQLFGTETSSEKGEDRP
jgi:hypothetical protein